MYKKIVISTIAAVAFAALTGCFEAAPRGGVVKREPIYREPAVKEPRTPPPATTPKSTNTWKYLIKEDYEGFFDWASGRYTNSVPDCFKGITIGRSWTRCKERHVLPGGKIYTCEMKRID